MPDDPPIMLAALSGKTSKIDFEVEVKVVKKKILPEVTDEWVKETIGFDDVASMRSTIADSIAQQKSAMMPRIKENAVLVAVAERLEGEAPESMREEAESTLIQDFFQQLQSQNMSFDLYLAQQGMTPDQFKEDVKLQAADIAAQDLALDAWARHFGLEATEEDVLAEFAKSGAEKPEALKAEWRENGQLHLVRQGVSRTKAVMDLMEKAVVTEVEPGAQDEKKKPAKKASSKKAAKADEAQDNGDKKPAAKKASSKKATEKKQPEKQEEGSEAAE